MHGGASGWVAGVTGRLCEPTFPLGTGKVGDTVLAFVVGAILMSLAGLVELVLGVRAERQSLEDLATPLTAAEPATT